jgi:tRNA modification GTPase
VAVFSTSDTIVAIATPPGRGALGVVRLSGPDAARIAAELAGGRPPFPPRRATFARLALRGAGEVGDEVIITSFPAPRSSTGEDCVEISAHGSPVVLASILRAAMGAGARLAEPGEFSLRGFLNGKRDLVQTEAVADLVDAVTPLQARAAFDQLQGTLTTAIAAIESELFDLVARLEASLDFPEEGYHFIGADEVGDALDRVLQRLDRLLEDAARGRLVREGAVVTLVGAPNVGKSSLFNALLNTSRAIVTPVPGTTRDLLTERVEIHGLSLALVDTAGLRPTDDVVEQEGVRRAKESLAVSELVLAVLDRSRPLHENDRKVLDASHARCRVIVVNKVDLPAAWIEIPEDARTSPVVEISARTGHGLADLTRQMATVMSQSSAWHDVPSVTNVRHIALLQKSREALMRSRVALTNSGKTLPEEFLLADIQGAQDCLQAITGRRSSDDLLRHIFERFCIGK